MFIKYLRYLLLSLLLYFSINNAFAEKFLLLEQKSDISGLIKVYCSTNILVIYMIQTKIWIIAKKNYDTILIVNDNDKLFCELPANKFRGNFAQRALISIFDKITTSKWKKISKEIYSHHKCSKYQSINLDYKNLKISQKDNKRFFNITIPQNKINFSKMECVVFDQFLLSKCQTYVLNEVYSLKHINNLPYSIILYYPNNICDKSLQTTKISSLNINFNDLVNYSKYKKVNGEFQVYNLKSKLTDNFKDILNVP